MGALQYGIIEVVNRCRKGKTVVKVTKEEDKGERNRKGMGNGNKQMLRRGQGAGGWKREGLQHW